MDGEYPGAERMPQQVQDLVGFLEGTLPPGHPYAKVKAQPVGTTSPEIWLLGSSDYSGALAAQLGLRFAFAHFITAFGGEVVSPVKVVHELGSERRETVRSVSVVGVGELRGADSSTRGPSRTTRSCPGCPAKGNAG